MKHLKIFLLSLCIAATALMLIFGKPVIAYVQEEIALAKWEPTPSGTVSEPKSSWVIDDTGWQYLSPEGIPAKEQWLTIDGKDYYFDETGYMTTGWIKQDGNWYYLDFAGEKETGWIDDEGKRYYLDETGVMVTGWHVIDQIEYHFDDSGSLSTGWVLSNDHYYYIDEGGTRHTGWLIDNEKYYYLDEAGIMKTGWLQDQGIWYFFQEDGAMVNGWQTIENKTYYFDEAGAMKTGWLQDGKNWYYFTDQGNMHTGWLKLDDGTYYLNSKGRMHTGWLIEGKKVYFFDSKGRYNANAKKVESGTKIALTFDDGPGPYTNRLLDCLEANNAKATFFVLGQQIDSYPDTILRAYQMGCQIGNHTYDHSNLTKLTLKEAKKQITSTNKKVKAITGKSSWVVRPPGGNYNDAVIKKINQPIITWSLDTRDWESQSAEAVIEKVLNEVEGGDIVLLHDIHISTVEAAEILIPTLKSLGYDLVTVSELAKSAGVSTLKRGSVYRSF